MIKKFHERFKKIGYFNETLKRAEDTEFTRRMKEQGIPVFYNPFLEIKHQYSTELAEILKPCFQSGQYRYYFEKQTRGHSSIRLQVLDLLLRPIWRAMQADSFLQTILYLPVIFLMHWVYTAGFYYAKFRKNKDDQKIP